MRGPTKVEFIGCFLRAFSCDRTQNQVVLSVNGVVLIETDLRKGNKLPTDVKKHETKYHVCCPVLLIAIPVTVHFMRYLGSVHS